MSENTWIKMIDAYVSHSRKFNFIKELYEPLNNSILAEKYNIIMPHESSSEHFPSKKLFEDNAGKIVVLADITYQSEGRDTELGWANDLNIPIIAFHREKTAHSIYAKNISTMCFEYNDIDFLIKKLESIDLEKCINL